MTAIAAASIATPSASAAPTPLSVVPAAAAQPAVTTAAPQPAVLVNISVSAASSAAPVEINATPSQVSSTLETMSSVNADVWDYNHIDWNVLYDKWGEAAVKNAVASFTHEIGVLSGDATSMASGLGLTVESTISLPNSTSAVISGSMTVAPFKFSNGGSSFSVTADANGNLVGTQDGQPWQTFQMGPPANDIPSTTAELVALLASFNANSASTNSSSTTASHSKVDMSV